MIMSFLVVFSLVVSPSFSLAAPSSSDLQTYLTELGWTQEQLEEHLDFYELTISDFDSVEEIKDFLGPVLTETSLHELLAEHGLTLEEATALLVENGELDAGETILSVYKFYDDLDFDLYFYHLTPITDDSLQQLLNDYGLTLDELINLLEDNGDSLENYEHIEDLEWAIDFYLYGSDVDFSDIDDLFSLIGLTDQELERLFEHFESLDYTNPAFLDKLEELGNRLMAFEDFEDPSDVTPEQLAELLDIFNQLLNLFELDVKYYLVKENEKNPVSIQQLITMTSTEGYGLLIEFYNKQGEFLADLFFTADMFGPELIIETGNDLKEMEKTIVEKAIVKKNSDKPVKKTEKGAKLPKTATDYVVNTASGLALAMAGLLIYRRFKVKHG
ncbi:processed acidic surface protein [Halalkalibacter alkalisediminis]|uniref:Processed acidic surface protein n=1 Tax=Halalkalibacter alkalisediminis TaxID=935616 RepID=A0ABV6NGG1_9BACI|nr:processed acidic surface protein [Halalkalibacter alkalisediminis]